MDNRVCVLQDHLVHACMGNDSGITSKPNDPILNAVCKAVHNSLASIMYMENWLLKASQAPGTFVILVYTAGWTGQGSLGEPGRMLHAI